MKCRLAHALRCLEHPHRTFGTVPLRLGRLETKHKPDARIRADIESPNSAGRGANDGRQDNKRRPYRYPQDAADQVVEHRPPVRDVGDLTVIPVVEERPVVTECSCSTKRSTFAVSESGKPPRRPSISCTPRSPLKRICSFLKKRHPQRRP